MQMILASQQKLRLLRLVNQKRSLQMGLQPLQQEEVLQLMH
jgi:hypothetical protein